MGRGHVVMGSTGLALGLLGAMVSGCGGGGSSGGTATPAVQTGASTPPAPAPASLAPPAPAPAAPAPSAPPAAPPLPDDAQVRAALSGAGIGPVTTRATTPELVALGRALFFDKELAGNRDIACATCHHPSLATGDALPLSIGTGASGLGPARAPLAPLIARNAPTLVYAGAAGLDRLFWDGRVARDPVSGALRTPVLALNGPNPPRPDLAGPLDSALAAQAMFPVTSREEMRGQPGQNELADAPDEVAVWAALMRRLVGTAQGTVGGIAAYRTLFGAAYPGTPLDDLTFSHAARAIAAYEAAELSRLVAPLDRYLAGDDAALSVAAKRGALVFTGAGRCAVCHRGPLLSDLRPHGVAAPQLGPGAGGEPDDRGVALVSGDRNDDYRFRTPPLRGVAESGPWMHTGAFSSLEAVVRHYTNPSASQLSYDASQLPLGFQGLVDRDPVRAQGRLGRVDPVIGAGIPLAPEQVTDVVAFLRALSDPSGPAPVPAQVPSGLPVD